MTELTKQQFDAASARGEARLKGPRAESAHYDAGRNRVVIRLTTGLEIGFAPRQVEGLERAKAEDLDKIEITPAGLGVHFPKLDADLYIPALLDGVLGSASWMAGLMGRKGGKSRSPSKASAARENGKRGGRPRKTAA
ncbi:DUF2442 domain-containing protein [Methylosinus sp. Sm6]|jgi:hypothetical protein|uniref:DUF2442 domain-containing protein n=1 Tax=Methylosinus sp. Sm6 TaxID=2866948 RepID=UPI001C99AFCB|nr:DUF2442 domain-containing protein [Methylosinus sp. Sm6]MBY6240348.1 DUF2442 domain-containing protein [Methylosinus sp. Sm6]